MKLLNFFLAAFAKIFFELFADEARMRCAMKVWYVFILITIKKKKRLIAVPANSRPLRHILILRKVFEMKTTVKLKKECPDKLTQLGFNEKSKALTPIVMIVLAASMH